MYSMTYEVFMHIRSVHPIHTPPLSVRINLHLSHISAGFPSPADGHIDKALDLNELLIEHPAATFFVRVQGDSMEQAGIQSGDILVVDRSLKPKEGDVIIAILYGEFTVKRWICSRGSWYLKAENDKYPAIAVNEESEFEIWGVVTHAIHSL